MTLVRRPSPFGELVTLRQAMDRIFDEDFFRRATAENGVLRLRIPKTDQVKPRQIRISPVTEGSVQSGGTASQGSGNRA